MFKAFLEAHREIIIEPNAHNGICFDGAVDTLRYFKNKQRLVFLLKETNGNKNNGERNENLTDWDYMEWVRKQSDGIEPLYRSVYRNIAMWSKMFCVYAKEQREPVLSEFIDNCGIVVNRQLLDSLKDIAIINLKKSWGVEQTDWNQMKQYLENPRRQEILLHQMAELKPTLVLCGGTFDFAHQIFGGNCNISKVMIPSGQKVCFFKVNDIIFVQCYHPSRPGWSRKNSFEHIKNIFSVVLMRRNGQQSGNGYST